MKISLEEEKKLRKDLIEYCEDHLMDEDNKEWIKDEIEHSVNSYVEIFFWKYKRNDLIEVDQFSLEFIRDVIILRRGGPLRISRELPYRLDLYYKQKIREKNIEEILN